jgi:hypothetical protein
LCLSDTARCVNCVHLETWPATLDVRVGPPALSEAINWPPLSKNVGIDIPPK